MKRFANAIVVVCLAVSLAVTAVVVWEYHRLNEALPAGVVTALLGLWGGELLILAVRQIFGSDVMTKTKSNDNPNEHNTNATGFDYGEEQSI